VAERPVAGRDYPRTLAEFNVWFDGEESCLGFLERLRWPHGFVCPSCGAGEVWRLARARRLRCAGCRRELSITAGTVFADSHLPLMTWFAAAWYVTGQKPGASALGLQRMLGLGSYRTAWAMLHKLRRAMVRPGRDLLSGELEVDETAIGAAPLGITGRGAFNSKAIVAIAVEALPRGVCGRVRLARIPDCSQATLTGFVGEVVLPGSIVYTDHWAGYNGLSTSGFTHIPTSINASGDPAHVAMPRVHRVSALLKRWLLGTHQGAPRPSHLDYYLDEFTFRFNRRTARHRGLVFYRLIEQAAHTDHIPIKHLHRHQGASSA
jgi:transposase-like protein